VGKSHSQKKFIFWMDVNSLVYQINKWEIKYKRKETNKRKTKNMQKKTNNNSTNINQWFDP